MQDSISLHKADRLYVMADDESFDQEFLRDCEIEGFETVYLPFQEDPKRSAYQLDKIRQSLSVSESYGVIGENVAHAAILLEKYVTHVFTLLPCHRLRQCCCILFKLLSSAPQ